MAGNAFSRRSKLDLPMDPQQFNIARFMSRQPIIGGDLKSTPGGLTFPIAPAQTEGVNLINQLEPEQQEDAHPIKSAIARALVGFSRGAAATPKEGAYSPLAGGVIGGLSATGQSILDEETRQNNALARRLGLVDVYNKKLVESKAGEGAQVAKENRASAREAAERAETMKHAESAIRLRAKLHGITDAQAAEIRRQAADTVASLGITPENPAWRMAYEQEADRLLDSLRQNKQGVHGPTTIPKPGAPSAAPGAAGSDWRKYVK